MTSHAASERPLDPKGVSPRGKPTPDVTDQTKVQPDSCDSELDNLVKTFKLLRPKSGSARIGDIELFGGSIFVNGEVGGDHIVILEFEAARDAALELGPPADDMSLVVVKRTN